MIWTNSEAESENEEDASEQDDEEDLEEEDMGEFLALLKDFKERLHLLRTQLQPLLQRARNPKCRPVPVFPSSN